MSGFGYNVNGFGVVADAKSFVTLSYAVVAGGGGGGHGTGGAGGGGAGGVLEYASVANTFEIGVAYNVTIGAGGTANGNDSTAFTTTATGGGEGGDYNAAGSSGGSGGGAGYLNTSSASGTAGQGNAGGASAGSVGPYYGGSGGGGKSAAGTDGEGSGAGAGGAGKQLVLDGNNVLDQYGDPKFVAGGGGGGAYTAPGASGGSGGGGDGSGSSAAAQQATAFTGGGGGGGGDGSLGQLKYYGRSGGSGFIAISYPSTLTVTLSAGIGSTTATVGSYKIISITAAGASDTITFG